MTLSIPASTRATPKPSISTSRPRASRCATRWNASCPVGRTRSRPALRDGERLLIAAHGNSIRALIKHLEHIGDDAISQLNVPTGMPLAYQLDEHLDVVSHGYLASEDEIAEASARVAAQGRAAP